MAGVPEIRFTLSEASTMLNPPVTERQLADIVRALGMKPAGVRRTGTVGRPERVFDWAQVLRLHEALIPFLESR